MRPRTLMLLFVFLALPLAAQTRHPIAKIEFHGTKIPAAILLAESTLAENASYSDEELRRAVFRIKRLPYVFDARYSVDGTTLVVDVTDMHRLFYAVNTFSGRFGGDGQLLLDSGVGGRFFFRPGGVLEATAGSSVITDFERTGSATLQYSQHGIGGTRLFAAAGVTATDIFGGRERRELVPHATVGLPLTPAQTVSLTAFREHSTFTRTFSGPPRPLRNSARRDTAELRWRYDTTDDPFFSLRGTSLALAPRYIRESSHFEGFSRSTIFESDERGHTASILADARRYLAIGTRNSVFGGATAQWSRRDVDVTRLDIVARERSTLKLTEVSAGWGHNFFDLGNAEWLNRSRLEMQLSLFREAFDRAPPSFSEDYLQYTLAYVFRHRWGTIRAVASIATER